MTAIVSFDNFWILVIDDDESTVSVASASSYIYENGKSWSFVQQEAITLMDKPCVVCFCRMVSGILQCAVGLFKASYMYSCVYYLAAVFDLLLSHYVK